MDPVDSCVYLTRHSALEVLQPHWREYLALNLTAMQSGVSPPQASASQLYAAGVCEKVVELDNALSGLRLACGFAFDISRSENPDAEAYRYHYESFILRALGIVDRAHRLVGASLVLPRKKYESVGGNRFVQEQSALHQDAIHPTLMTVVAAADKYRPSRNEIVHSSSYSSRELGLFESIARLGIDTGAIDVHELARRHFSSQSLEMGLSVAALVSALNALLEALRPAFLVAAEYVQLQPTTITKSHPVALPTDGTWMGKDTVLPERR